MPVWNLGLIYIGNDVSFQMVHGERWLTEHYVSTSLARSQYPGREGDLGSTLLQGEAPVCI